AVELLGQAKDAESKGSVGGALVLFERIANEFPFDEAVLAEAESRRDGLLRKKEELSQKVAKASAQARFLKNLDAYHGAEAEADAAAKALAGTDYAQAFAAEHDAIVAERETLARQRGEVDAERLLRRIETALAESPPRTLVAKEIAQYLAK